VDLESVEMVQKKLAKLACIKFMWQQKELVEINDLHDLALFLGHSQSHCPSAKAYPQVRQIMST
jgi:hypothetical protein